VSGSVPLVLLLASTLLFLLGVRELAAGSARRSLLAERSAGPRREERGVRLRRAVDDFVRGSRAGRRVASQVTAAGVSISPLDFLLASAAAALVVLLVAWLFLPPLLALAAAALGACAPWWGLERRRLQRRDEFVAQLPELARLLSNGASAGLSIPGALQMSVGELEDPARAEIRMVLEELRIGQSLEAALDRMAARMPSRELGVLVGTLVIQQRMGGDVVRALADMAETLEARKDLLREVRTLMAGSVFTAWLVAIMGVAMIFILNAISPGALDRMTSEPVGILTLAVSGTLYTIGLVAIRRVTKVEP
jgi:tight adherence protein B